MYTVEPLTNVLPVADDTTSTGTLGPVVSTSTVVDTVALFPTLSTPANVNR